MKTNKTDFSTYLKQSSSEIEEALTTFSKDWNTAIENKFIELKKLNKRFTNGFFGGKMLRGVLVKLGYELVKTNSTEAILKPASAFEIVHTFFLIHDDIIDQSPTRRGKPAMHLINGNTHYGISQAICLGDLGLALATKLLNESNFPPALKTRSLNFFLQVVTDTILGEMLDIESATLPEQTEKLVLDIHTLKTANYTIIGPMSVGAILGGADDTFLTSVKQFGEPLGIAYQIQDDILGIYGDEKQIGKSITSDIEENKSTLLLTFSLTHGTNKQKEMIKKYYGKEGITKDQHEMIKKIFTETGALAYSQEKINELIIQAKGVIPQLTKNETKQELLTQLTDVLVNRKK